MKTSQLLQAFLQHHDGPRLADKTRGKIRHDISRMERFTGPLDPTSISAASFDLFRSEAQFAGLKARTIEDTISTVLTILRACPKELVASVPERGKSLDIPPPNPRVPPLTVLGAMFAHADAAKWPRPSGPYWRAYLATIYFTALRRGDVMRLLPDDLRGEMLTMVASKTGKTLNLPVHPVLARLVREIPSVRWRQTKRDSHLLFPVRGKQIYDALKQIAEAAGVTPLGPQQIRRLAAEQFELAHAECGRIILQHSIKGATQFYIRQQTILGKAIERLKVPDEFLTDEERERQACQYTAMNTAWHRLDPTGRETVLRVAQGMAN